MSRIINIRAIPAGQKTVQVDLDTKRDLHIFKRMIRMLRARSKRYDMPHKWRYRINKSKSGKHWHAIVTKVGGNPLSDMERIALQACLGSDRVREMLSLIRAQAGSRYPTLFFEKIQDNKIPRKGLNW